ncbi:thioredoxin domain-containing protein [Yunchengibacter salinarum]|uniref:thioredoxin domain-containing protein n=1 Tax=Yunchengibacter salinarum TaxID=3133399 RepID=UPI0035B69C76
MLRLLAIATFSLMLAACGNGSDSDGNGKAGDDAGSDAAMVADSAAAQGNSTDGANDSANDSGEGYRGDLVWGPEDAPVTVIEYASLTCPHCARFSTGTFPKIKETFVDQGQVKFIFRHFVMNQLDLAASTVMRCEGQPVAKKLLKVFFQRQQDWARAESPVDALAGYARRVGISRTQFDRCLSNTGMHRFLVKMSRDGQQEYNITGTPTLVVNGEKVEDFRWENLESVIRDAL